MGQKASKDNFPLTSVDWDNQMLVGEYLKDERLYEFTGTQEIVESSAHNKGSVAGPQLWSATFPLLRKEFVGSKCSLLNTITYLFFGNMQISQKLGEKYSRLSEKSLSFDLPDLLNALQHIADLFSVDFQVCNFYH